MSKFNQKGFVLAETLIVTIFLMLIFTMIYSNFYPLIGEYEKREVYDDVDGKYAVYWIKRFIEDATYQLNPTKEDQMRNQGYVMFDCSDIQDSTKQNACKNLVNALGLEGCDANGNGGTAYITKYTLKESDTKGFKITVQNNAGGVFKSGFQDYVFALPNYEAESLNNANYRVLAVFKHEKSGNNYYSYATIEVNK